MSNTLYFATTNKRKINEANEAAKLFKGIVIKPTSIETIEIQSDSAEEIATEKAKQAYSQLRKPIVVTDTFWSIPALAGFPGAYMKHVSEKFEAEDWLALMKRHSDKTVVFSENIAFYDGKDSHFITRPYSGKIVEPRGKFTTSIEEVAEFNGRTLAEAHESGTTSHDPKEYIWYEFFKWYTDEHVV
jgi:XTP/dITP diphosphohydrolase